jgi:hypothetical protein
MKKRYIQVIGICFSILLHLCIFLFLFWKPTILPPPPPPPEKQKPVSVRLIARNDTTKENIPITKDGWKLSRRDPELCRSVDGKTYVGIGIKFDPWLYKITRAPEQYPAYIAGMRVGDALVNPYASADENGYIDMDVFRGEQRISFHIKREKICYVIEPKKIDKGK